MEEALVINEFICKQIRLDALTLANVPSGSTARVVRVGGVGATPRRLMEMGVVPGAPVRVIKRAPLGDPIEIKIRGYNLALRKSEAETILVSEG